jgi:hypothetical protein
MTDENSFPSSWGKSISRKMAVGDPRAADSAPATTTDARSCSGISLPRRTGGDPQRSQPTGCSINGECRTLVHNCPREGSHGRKTRFDLQPRVMWTMCILRTAHASVPMHILCTVTYRRDMRFSLYDLPIRSIGGAVRGLRSTKHTSIPHVVSSILLLVSSNLGYVIRNPPQTPLSSDMSISYRKTCRHDVRILCAYPLRG